MAAQAFGGGKPSQDEAAAQTLTYGFHLGRVTCVPGGPTQYVVEDPNGIEDVFLHGVARYPPSIEEVDDLQVEANADAAHQDILAVQVAVVLARGVNALETLCECV